MVGAAVAGLILASTLGQQKPVPPIGLVSATTAAAGATAPAETGSPTAETVSGPSAATDGSTAGTSPLSVPSSTATGASTAVTTGASAAVTTGAATTSISATAGVLTWSPCGAFDCAVMTSPLDYADPNGATVDISVIRRKAGSPDQRIGALFLNPGGPGGSAVTAVRAVDKLLPPQVLTRFDVIGVEPRGVGATELPCTFATIASSIPDGPIAEVFGSYRRECAKLAGALASHVDTPTSARDIDRVRAAIGDQQISFVGLSWGSYLGGVYSQLFGSHLRAFVADSPEDLDTVGAQRLQDRVAAWEATLRAFGDACKAEPVTSCALNDGVDPLVHIDRISAALAKIPDGEAGTSLRMRFERTLLDALSVGGGPNLSAAVSELGRAADATAYARFEATVQQLRQSFARNDAPSIAPNDATAALFGVGCIDGKLPTAPVTLDAPHFAEYSTFLGATLNCSGWPVGVVRRTTTDRFSGRALVIGTTLDDETPYPWSQRTAAQIGGTLLTRDGLGHISLGRSNACVDKAVTAYLIDLATPRADLRC